MSIVLWAQEAVFLMLGLYWTIWDRYMQVLYLDRFENGLKLSIRGRIIGFHLWDMDSMVGAALTIEREIKDTWNTRDTGIGNKREDQVSPSSGKRQKTSSSH